jgi:hypothetical protein
MPKPPKPPLSVGDQNPGKISGKKILGKIDLGKVGRYNADPFEGMSLLMLSSANPFESIPGERS